MPLEIMIHCQFKGFSFPPPLCTESESNQLLLDMALQELPESVDLFSAIEKQAICASGRDRNMQFRSFFDNINLSTHTFCQTMKNAVKEEMSSNFNQYSKFFSSENRNLIHCQYIENRL
jgi:hypothetical protein